ncbi:MAG: transketolase family protein [Actinomycetota bacterium]
MSLASDRSFNGLTNQNRNVQLRIPAVALADLAEHDDRIVAASADLKVSTQLSEFEARHPKRFFQFGISERNMMAAAAGMASCGLLPYVGTFASFSGLMCLENIRTDMAYPNMAVRVLATHAGVACGFFAVSHHATEDISAVRAVANLMVLSPCDGNSAAALIRSTVEVPGPIYMRFGRGRETPVYPDDATLAPGAPTVLRRGANVLIAATGVMVQEALDAAERLEEAGIGSTVVDVHTLKPFPNSALAELAAAHGAVVTVEEHNVLGGLGSMVTEAVADAAVSTPIYRHGFYDEYAIIGSPTHLYEYYGLDGNGIATVVHRVLDLVQSGALVARRAGSPLWTAEDRAAALAAVRARSSRATEVALPAH